MTIISLILIFAVILILKRKDSYINQYVGVLSITASVEILNLRGGFIYIGNTGIGHKLVVEIALFIISLYVLYKKRFNVNRKLFTWINLLWLAIIIGLLYELILPVDFPVINYDTEGSWDGYYAGVTNKESVHIGFGWSLLLMWKTFVFSIQCIIVKSYIDKEQLKKILRKVTSYCKIGIYYGCFEVILKYILPISISEIVNLLIFGNEVDEFAQRGELIALTGLEKEPSHFVFSLFLTFLLMLISKRSEVMEHRRIEYFMIFVLMIISGGFSAIYFIPMAMIGCYIVNKKEHFKLGYIVSFILLTTFFAYAGIQFLDYLAEADYVFFSDKARHTIAAVNFIVDNRYVIAQTSSSLARLGSIYETFLDFLQRPIWGLGLGVEACHGGLVTMLSDFGIAGTLILMIVLNKKSISNLNYDLVFGIFFIFIVNLLMGLRTYPVEVYGFLIYEFTSLYEYKKVT